MGEREREREREREVGKEEEGKNIIHVYNIAGPAHLGSSLQTH